MQRKTNKPIFIVGSPRSGTSILAWCLGQHPNILPVPESNWMGEFAVNLAISYQIGAARGDRSILSAMDIRDDELFAAFGHSINELILRHRKDLESKREERSIELGIQTRWLEATSTSAGPKERWVDGTPEYSLHICGLRKLFPGALFVHLVRDVDSVVRSLLNFHRVSGTRLVANEEEAYKYWLRRVNACLKAEQAYGPAVVHRLLYSSLIENPESAIRSLLDFLGEPYSSRCLEPLAERINSSNVPPDFKSDDPATDLAIVEEARQLSAEIEENCAAKRGLVCAAAEMEAAFEKRAQYVATLHSAYWRDKSRLESAISAYQTENSRLQSVIRVYQAEQLRLESAIAELQRQFADLSRRLAQANDQISHMSRLLDCKNVGLAEREKYIVDLASRLRKQLCDTRKLSDLLDNVQDAAERLRNSRRWKLANPGTAIKVKLSRSKVSTGYGHLDRIVAAYSQWRASHPEIAKIDDPTEAARSAILPSNSGTKVDDFSETQSIHNDCNIENLDAETEKSSRA